jgi:hypothetical protein
MSLRATIFPPIAACRRPRTCGAGISWPQLQQDGAAARLRLVAVDDHGEGVDLAAADEDAQLDQRRGS